MYLWLDDVRDPNDFGAIGWTWVKTVPEAKKYLLHNRVDRASLDHDLGACEICLNGKTEAQWLEENNYQSMPNCSHIGTGYDLVCWMEETGNWPLTRPTVHSANPVGRQRMEQVIRKHWDVR